MPIINCHWMKNGYLSNKVSTNTMKQPMITSVLKENYSICIKTKLNSSKFGTDPFIGVWV